MAKGNKRKKIKAEQLENESIENEVIDEVEDVEEV